MEHVTVVAMLALIQYLYFAAQVSKAREAFKIAAPATTGDETFERIYRVHQNTLEQLIMFLPGLFAFATYVHPLVASGIGLVYVIGRYLYSQGYTKAAEKRGLGAGVSGLAVVALLLGGLAGAVVQIVRSFGAG